MKFSVHDGDAANARTDLLVLPLFESALSGGDGVPSAVAALDRALDGLLLGAARREGFRAKPDQSWMLHTHRRLAAERVMLVGLGLGARYTPEVLRLAVGRAIKAAQRARAADVAVAPPVGEPSPEANVRAVVEGALLGHYRFDRYRTQAKDDRAGSTVERVQLVLTGGLEKSAFQETVRLAEATAEATNWARDLVNEPAGVMTPKRLAAEARSLAKLGLRVAVRGRREIEALRMGMFLGVAQGSDQEPQLIEVSYEPKQAAAAARPAVALVGKAITFDSGGLSLKTAEGMVDMKTDMAGAAAVLGAMRVVAKMQPPFPVRGYMGACENMPSGTAYRPGDVLVSRLGKTVEITNTDAEGRLVLGDVLALASEAKPAALIDVATLTGACMIALGHHIAGVWGENEETVSAFLAAARSAGEEMWRMPLFELQKDALRSEVADMKNAGERWGGAINAALFLREFVGDTPWVHVDIAGPSQSTKERGYHGKGATGVGVRTLVEFVRRRAEEVSSLPAAAPGDRKRTRARTRRS
ncbi:MAG TPA: leucyl aminopeptidase [Myxococcaceae bacterium]|nr:leucyl aminopeptidase [Myxococcaceae bacterium]